jgi:ribA/ribD-fused uncharacterized protein
VTADIRSFSGDHAFLSNFYPSPLTFRLTDAENPDGVYFTAPTVEHAFQAMKLRPDNFSRLTETARILRAATPGNAKKLGRVIPLREDWDSVKDNVMLWLLNKKFSPWDNPGLSDLLVATGDALLIEGNTWGDTYWGVDSGTGEGQNRLGELLMQVRDSIIESRGQHL